MKLILVIIHFFTSSWYVAVAAYLKFSNRKNWRSSSRYDNDNSIVLSCFHILRSKGVDLNRIRCISKVTKVPQNLWNWNKGNYDEEFGFTKLELFTATQHMIWHGTTSYHNTSYHFTTHDITSDHIALHQKPKIVISYFYFNLVKKIFSLFRKQYYSFTVFIVKLH